MYKDDIVQEAVIKTIHKKKKCKKVKWLSEKALQTAVKRRDAKDKAEKRKIYPFEGRVQIMALRVKKPPHETSARTWYTGKT